MTAGARPGGATRFNEALYDQFWNDCPDFSRYNPGARHRRRIITEIVRALPGRSLLDVGCGNGELLLWLEQSIAHLGPISGADLSSETVRRNTDRLPHVTFHTLDIAREALPSRHEIVVCSEVVEHIDDRRTAFTNLAKMVEPGGHLLVTCPTGHVYETEKSFGHVSHPTESEMIQLGSAVGLVHVSSENWGFPLYKAMKWATNVNVGFAMKNFASGRYSPGARLVSNALYWANYLNWPSSRAGCQLFSLFRR
jgi:SAM-dependent methyltransferase